MDDAARHAVFYAPPAHSPLAAFGRRWLGRDAQTGTRVPQPGIAGVTAARLAEITAAPRTYGFHATLKPPFRLAGGRSRGELEAALRAFAAARAPVTTPPLRLGVLGGFLALLPAETGPALARLAGDCVRAFDRFRAPPTEADLAQRRAAGLDARQAALLARWGYPYLFEEFRFHLTLTDRLAEPERTRLAAALAPLVAPLRGVPLEVDSICLFVQPAPDIPFTLACRFPFVP